MAYMLEQCHCGIVYYKMPVPHGFTQSYKIYRGRKNEGGCWIRRNSLWLYNCCNGFEWNFPVCTKKYIILKTLGHFDILLNNRMHYFNIHPMVINW